MIPENIMVIIVIIMWVISLYRVYRNNALLSRGSMYMF